MKALTINEAAQVTGWSPRMLRYIERIGLLELQRSEGGYRLYGAEELQRLRTLRELLAQYDVSLADVGFALRLHREPPLHDAVETWLEEQASRPAHVAPDDWLRWEQDKHQALIAADQPTAMETA